MSEQFPDPVGEEAVPEPVEPVEPAWSGPSQEEWQAQQQLIGYVAQQLQPQEEQPAVDPFAEDYQAQLDRYLEEKLAPIQSVTQQQIYSQAEEQAMQMLHGYAEKDGGFLLPDSMSKARALANDYLATTQKQYGYGPKAAEAALRLAYDNVKQWESQVGEAYHRRQLEQLQGLGSVRREPQTAGINGAAQQLVSVNGPGDETSVVRKYFG